MTPMATAAGPRETCRCGEIAHPVKQRRDDMALHSSARLLIRPRVRDLARTRRSVIGAGACVRTCPTHIFGFAGGGPPRIQGYTGLRGGVPGLPELRGSVPARTRRGSRDFNWVKRAGGATVHFIWPLETPNPFGHKAARRHGRSSGETHRDGAGDFAAALEPVVQGGRRSPRTLIRAVPGGRAPTRPARATRAWEFVVDPAPGAAPADGGRAARSP